MYKVKGEN